MNEEKLCSLRKITGHHRYRKLIRSGIGMCNLNWISENISFVLWDCFSQYLKKHGIKTTLQEFLNCFCFVKNQTELDKKILVVVQKQILFLDIHMRLTVHVN